MNAECWSVPTVQLRNWLKWKSPKLLPLRVKLMAFGLTTREIKHCWWSLLSLSLSGFWYDRSNPWWRHQMETFSALLAICAGNSSVPGEFPAQRPVTRSFDVFFDLCLNKRLSKQSSGWWFEMLSRPLWRHCHAFRVRESFSPLCMRHYSS